MVSGVAAATLALFWLTRLDASSTFLLGVLPSEIVMSLGLGLFFVSLSTVALSGVGLRDAGVAERDPEHYAADRWGAGTGAAEHGLRVGSG